MPTTLPKSIAAGLEAGLEAVGLDTGGTPSAGAAVDPPLPPAEVASASAAAGELALLRRRVAALEEEKNLLEAELHSSATGEGGASAAEPDVAAARASGGDQGPWARGQRTSGESPFPPLAATVITPPAAADGAQISEISESDPTAASDVSPRTTNAGDGASGAAALKRADALRARAVARLKEVSGQLQAVREEAEAARVARDQLCEALDAEKANALQVST